MLLEMILQRNALYHVYLEERYDSVLFDRIILNGIRFGENELMRLFNETGNMFYNDPIDKTTSDQINFDEWLFQRQHYDLVDFVNYPEDPKGLIDYVKTEGKVIDFSVKSNPWYKKNNLTGQSPNDDFLSHQSKLGSFFWDADRTVKWFDKPDGKWLMEKEPKVAFPGLIEEMRNYGYRVG